MIWHEQVEALAVELADSGRLAVVAVVMELLEYLAVETCEVAVGSEGVDVLEMELAGCVAVEEWHEVGMLVVLRLVVALALLAELLDVALDEDSLAADMLLVLADQASELVVLHSMVDSVGRHMCSVEVDLACSADVLVVPDSSSLVSCGQAVRYHSATFVTLVESWAAVVMDHD